MFDLLKACLVCAPLLLFTSLTAADPSADAGPAARLIGQLGSSRFAEREAATQALDALGPAALDALRQAVESDDAEVRRRAQKLVRQIETRRAASRTLEPKRIRLVYRDTPVTEAVTDLSRRTGLSMQIHGNLVALQGRRLTLDTGETTFWDAFSQFCSKAGLAERGLSGEAFHDERQMYHAGDRRIIALDRTNGNGSPRANSPLLLADGKGPELPTCHAGAVRLRALPLGTAVAHFTRAEDEALVVLEALPEPHLQWHSVLAVRVDRAVDDQGNVLKQPAVGGALGAAVGGGAEETVIIWDGAGEFPASPFGDARHVPIRFRLAGKPGKSLKELKGTIAAQVRTPSEPLAVVDGVLDAAGKPVAGGDGSSLRVVEVKRNDSGNYQVRAVVIIPAPELVSGGIPARLILSSRGWWGRGMAVGSPDSSDLALLDARGRRFPLVGAEVNGALGKGIVHDFTLHYQPLADQAAPARLVYSGRRTVTVEVPFALRDVPLP